MKPLFFVATAIVILCIVCQASAQMVVGRYGSINGTATLAQQHLLQQTVRITFPSNVLTLEQAIRHLLQFSGYQLTPPSTLSPTAQVMLQQPLPATDRTLGPLPLRQSLTVLAGPTFIVLVDPVHRFIGFSLKTLYQGLYPTTFINE